MGALCEDCQTEAWLEVLELASEHKACRLSLARSRPPCLERLKVVTGPRLLVHPLCEL